MEKYTGLEVAVIGLAGRFPMAGSVGRYWENLMTGRDCVSDLSDNELLEEGEPETLIKDPNYVKAAAFLEDKHFFDEAFFRYTPDEAELMDPQLRIFHECCWEAIEDSGYDVTTYKDKIGLFAAATPNVNWELYSAYKNRELLLDEFSAALLRDCTFLGSRIAYRLNLRGPVVFSHTACSSSLVNIHQACNSLLLGECKMALAGGITIRTYSRRGYLYQAGMIYSRDGRCRPFDMRCSGTIGGEGAGVVVLKRLKDALRDRDHIYGLIKGSAVNNDGSNKIGFTSPGVSGQSDVITRALKVAAVTPDSIGYIEAHGTATELGDPIEIMALKEAFAGSGCTRVQTCGVGSVKSNIGHLDSAAGVAGFIKAILCINRKKLVPSLHYAAPNPKIDFQNSPFYVVDKLQDWEPASGPRRAGVSSFGIGGTNAHVILEEFSGQEDGSRARDCQLIVLSARNEPALQRNSERLAEYLSGPESADLADIAYTLQKGRACLAHRKILVCGSTAEAADGLKTGRNVSTGRVDAGGDPGNIVFLFPGQGAQYVNMCRDLYLKEKIFTAAADECFGLAASYTDADLRGLLFPETEPLSNKIDDTKIAQPLLFIIEYCLARLLLEWGIRPDLMMGHSIGEYTAACLSDVLSLEDTLRLVVRRGELMSGLKRGAMLSVDTDIRTLQPLLYSNGDVDLAVVNSSTSLVVSGPSTAIVKLNEQLTVSGIRCRQVRTSHAFHSRMMDDILDAFEKEVSAVQINPPRVPYISNLTGGTAQYADIRRSSYWSAHLRRTVQFSAGAGELLRKGKAIFLELGPGRSLCNAIQANELFSEEHEVINFGRQAGQHIDDQRYLLEKLGQCWLKGVPVSWDAFYGGEKRNKVSLPGYSFDKVPYTTNVDAVKLITAGWKADTENGAGAGYKGAAGILIPSWQRTLSPVRPADLAEKGARFLVVGGEEEFSGILAAHLCAGGQQTTYVKGGQEWSRLFADLAAANIHPDHIIYCALLTKDPGACETPDDADNALDAWYPGLAELARSLEVFGTAKEITLTIACNYLADIFPGDKIDPLKATIHGPAQVIPLENPLVSCKVVDLPYPFHDTGAEEEYASLLVNEVVYDVQEPFVGYRAGARWIRSFHPLPDAERQGISIRKAGCYIITGGTGGIGLTLADAMVHRYGATVILVHRSDFPGEETEAAWLSGYGEDDPVSIKIRQIQRMRSTGSRVVLYRMDVASPADVIQFAGWVRAELPEINGLLWAAGEIDYGGILLNRSRSELVRYLSSKVHGLLLFRQYFDLEQLDFVMLCSSIGNVFHQLKFGQVAYQAANQFLESFALHAWKTGRMRVTAINWCDWLEVGITVKAHIREFHTNDLKLINSKIKGGISPGEGVQIFEECLRSGAPVANIYKGNLQEAIGIYRGKLLEQKRSLTGGTAGPVTPAAGGDEDLPGRLQEIFGAFFPGRTPGVDDDFFELGGDSLKGMTLVSRCNKLLGATLTISDVYKNPTPRTLSQYLRNGRGGKAVKGIPRAAVKSRYAMSSAQKRLFFLQLLNKDSTVYNETQFYKVRGPLDMKLLEDAFAKLIRQHESLRTFFVLEDDVPEQRISDDVKLHIEYFGDQETDIHEVARAFVRPFDPGTAPLVRVGIRRNDDEECLLMIDMHHAIADGTSQRILMRDFMAFYNKQEVPATYIQYKDYAEWQQSEEQQQEMAALRKFWMNEFNGEIRVPEMPADFPRPLVKTFAGSFVDFTIEAVDTGKLSVLCAAEGASLFMTLLAAFNIFMARLSGQEDIVIGTPVAGRQQVELENVVGMFANTIPLRNYPKGELPFREFLADLKQRVLACFDQQAYQFENLIEDLRIQGDLGHNPLFDVMFSFKNMANPEFALSGLSFEPYVSEELLSRFDLTLWATESNGRIECSLQYSTELFRRDTIDRFIGYFKRIVASIAADPDIRIGAIDILPEKERSWLLAALDNSRVCFPEDKTVSGLFEEQVKRTPGKTAVKMAGEALTYLQLDERSGKLAFLLRREGVRPGEIIGLLTGRSVDTVVGMLAILKAGGAYLPIDAEYPEERKRYLVADSGMKMILVTEGDVRFVPAEVSTIFISAMDELPDGDYHLEFVNSPGDLCYVIYTSGTTGNPKGVMIEHRNVVRLFFNDSFAFNFGPGDVWTMFHSPCFDFSVWEIYGALLYGGTLVIIPRTLAWDTASYLTLLKEEHVTVLNQTPSAFYNLAREEMQCPEALLRLNYVIFGGEALSPARLSWWKKRYPGTRMINMFGITETTVHVTYKELDEADIEKDISNVGKPIPTLSVYVLDGACGPVPKGVRGELYVGGAGIARGYLGKRDLTEKKFIPSPFRAGDILYRSGDWGRILANGELEYLGRMDQQVKLRGFRIELGEIESQLSGHDEVRQSVVLIVEKDGEQHLVAYYVSGVPLEAADLRAYLAARLPHHMIPSFFVHLERLPLTSNGKLDKAALPEAGIKRQLTYTAPSSETEHKLVGIWAAVLKVDPSVVGVDSNFFDLGGQSLKAVSLGSRIEKEFNVRIPLLTIFMKPTIRELQTNIQISRLTKRKGTSLNKITI